MRQGRLVSETGQRTRYEKVSIVELLRGKEVQLRKLHLRRVSTRASISPAP